LKNRVPRKTADGSTTFYLPDQDEHFHSIHGAMGESLHVYIQEGLGAHNATKNPLRVLEYGFGTGLNALLAWNWSLNANKEVQLEYTSLETYPLLPAEYTQLNYASLLSRKDAEMVFREMHESEWDAEIALHPRFKLRKLMRDAMGPAPEGRFDVIFYDAFAPAVQPEFWSAEQFGHVAAAMDEGSLLVTYCVQGHARRAMESAGLQVEKIPGPPGKREIARAWKI
jgi:tRNA U34 5-methylaminomethyl-2-thiouridine-forming methyltransferase MnmC